MDDKHKDFLALHRPKFVRIVDVDRLIPYLQNEKILNEKDIEELRRELTSSSKAEKLLDILPTKGSLAFHALCMALEATYPRLLSLMFFGKGSNSSDAFGDDIVSLHHDNFGSQDSAGISLSAFGHTYDFQSDMSLQKTEYKPSGSHVRHTSVLETQKGLAPFRNSSGENKMPSMGTLSKQGSNIVEKDSSASIADKTISSNRDYDRLKTQCDSAMRELQALRRQHTDTIRKCDSAMKDAEFFRMQHKLAVSKFNQLQSENLALKAQHNDELADKHRLEQEVANLQKFCEEDRKEMAELRRQQQEAMNGSCNNESIIAALRKSETIKDDYDALRKRYADLIASHSAATSKLKSAQEEISQLTKQLEIIMQERDGTMRERNGLKQQCTSAIRQWDIALRERNEVKEALVKVQQQRDEAMKEINQAMASKIKMSKDLSRLTEERNAAVQEYSLIMSERDSVHKEIEKLQEELAEANKKIKCLEAHKKGSLEEVETLRREIASALHDRDKAIKQCNDLREKYGDYDTSRSDSAKEREELPKDYDYYCTDRGFAVKDVMEHSSLTENYSKTQKERMENLDQANQEIDRLRKHVEKLQIELNEAVQEAEVSKRRRDWAFNERDKIVQERESIRTLCDKLRRERDRAVSDLAEALRDSDDIKKQRNEASKEVKELREKIEAQMEKESRIKHLNSVGHNHSRDSAIDADLQEWESETLELEIDAANMEELGFELSGGKDDPHFPECAIFVSNVLKGSPSDGKLRINDCLLKINNVDLTNADKRTALETLRSSGGIINLMVRRRRLTSSRFIQSVHLNLGSGKEHGLNLETGVYISRITPGSVAAKEGNLALGDRVVNINGRFLDGVRSGVEATKLLDVSGDSLVLAVLKCINSTNAPLSSSSSGHNIQETTDSEKNLNPRLHLVAGSPSKDPHCRGVNKEPAKKLTTSSSQTEDFIFVSNMHRPDETRSTREKQYSPVNSPTFIEKFFTDHRSSKERKNKKFGWESSLQEEEAIAELDSVIDHCKKHLPSKIGGKQRRRREKDIDKNGGTWPKYRGPPLEILHASPGTRTHGHRKNERVSIASLLNTPKLPSAIYGAKKMQERDRDQEHERELQRERQIDFGRGGRNDEGASEPRRASVSSGCDGVLDRDRGQCGFSIYNAEISQTTSMPSPSSLPSMKPVTLLPHFKSIGTFLPSGKSSFQSTSNSPVGSGSKASSSIHYSTNSIIDSPLDYSVVSANRNREVLEYYKNKNKTRPKSAMYIPNDVERFVSSDSSTHGKPSSLEMNLYKPLPAQHPPVENMSRNHNSPSEPLNLSPRLSDRSIPVHCRAPSQPCYTTGSVIQPSVLLSSSSVPSYYNVSNGRMQHSFSSIHSHPNTSLMSTSSSSSAGVGSPSPRYSSPPTLPYISRSGESLLGGSIPESSTLPDSRMYNHRFPGNPSPSPSSLHYSFSHSPSQSMELQHFHPKHVPPNHPSSCRSGDFMGFGGYDGPSTIPKGSRIRIPSNQSVTSKSSAGKVSTSSIERAASERSSPMPTFHVETIISEGAGVQRSVSDFQNKKPSPNELRSIRIDKSAEETLGINIDCGPRGGIFVSSVSENSLAAQAGIHIGDQLLEVCGINMRSATYLLAANVLRQCGDSVTMLVQYNPEKYQEVVGRTSSSSGSESSPAQTPTPRSSPKCGRNPLKLLNLDDLPASTTSTLKRQNTLIGSTTKDSKTNADMYAPRYVFLKMTSSNLGITFLGGNAVGIFVHNVQPDSPASGANGLRCGDQILEYNGIDLKHATAEEAMCEVAKRAETVAILAHYNIDRYSEIKDLPGDAFYVRAMFDHQAENPNELSFKKDDILFVDNTVYNGVSGVWRAWLVDEDGHKKQCGAIPSRYKVEEDLLLRRSLGELDSESGSRRSAMPARRSFFRRYRKHQRNNSRDIKELASFSDVSINSFSDSGTLIEDPPIFTYQRVERLADLSLRPVLLLGPLIEIVLDKLVQDFPQMFVRCNPEVVDESVEEIENGLQGNKYIDYRRRGSHFECITLSNIKEAGDDNCHCIIDVCPPAVERLHKNQIYPIVLFIKFKSTKQIREVRDPRLFNEKISTKAAKEMYEHSLRLENEYKYLISATIPGGNLAYMCAQVKAQVEQEQQKAVWVPEGVFDPKSVVTNKLRNKV